jgi:hypothetical protein
MRIKEVRTEQYHRYIPVKGWDNVEALLNLFEKGYPTETNSAENQELISITRAHGPTAALLYLETTSLMEKSGLTDEILTNAKQTLKSRESWTRDFDYDGMGTSFFKTSVKIKFLDRSQDLYAIGFYASYVGDQPEKDLAAHINAERCLIWSEVIIQTEKIGNQFTFDFDCIVDRIAPVLEVKNITGMDIARQMKKVDENNRNIDYVLKSDVGYQVTINPGEVESRYIVDKGKFINTWTIRNAKLSGKLAKDYEKNNGYKSPTIVISLSDRRKNSYGYDNFPIWQSERKKHIIDLTNKIVEAFS